MYRCSIGLSLVVTTIYLGGLCSCLRSGFVEPPDAAVAQALPVLDAGELPDTGPVDAPADGATIDDAGLQPDTSAVSDAAATPDSTLALDAFPRLDAVALFDAQVVDASSPADSGVASDGPLMLDIPITRLDAAVFMDTGAGDTGAGDTGAGDTGAAMEAGPSVDGTVNPPDAGANDADSIPTGYCSRNLIFDHGIPDRSMSAATSIALQADGAILVAGMLMEFSTVMGYVARHLESGWLDLGFALNGWLRHGPATMIMDVTVQPDGSLLAAGLSGGGSMVAVNPSATGQLSSSYGDKGTASIDNGEFCGCNALAAKSDGTAVLAGSCNTNNPNMAVARFLPSGLPDPALAGGIVTVDFGRDSRATDVALLANDQILLAGTVDQGGNSDGIGLAKLNSDGSADTSFGTLGLVNEDLGVADAYLEAVALQPDGKIVVAGAADVGGDFNVLLARFDENGSFDTSFSGGWTATDLSSPLDHVNDMALQADGKIVVVGSVQSTNTALMVARFTITGDLDTNFANGGVYVLTDGIDSMASAVVIAPDGVIFAAGNHENALVIARLDPNGVALPWSCSN